MKDELTITNNTAAQRFEVQVEGRTAFAAYHLSQNGKVITFTHTEVPGEMEGRGIGSKLARTALDAARANQQQIKPQCPFIAAYIRRHAEYQDLVYRAE